MSPRVVREGNVRVGGFNVCVVENRRQDFIVDETGEAVGNGVVFETALAVFAVVAPVFNRDRDKGRQRAVRILGNGQIVERVAHEVELTRPVMDDENGCPGAVFVGGWHIDEDLAFHPHRLLVGLERGVVALENFAVGQWHRKLEGLPLGIALVREIRIDLVVGTDGEIAVAYRAGILGVCVGGPCFVGDQANHANGHAGKTSREEEFGLQHGQGLRAFG